MKPVPGDLESASEVKDDKMKPTPRSVPQRNKRTARAAGRPQNEDSEVSDVDSVTEDASKPTTRRSARAGRKAGVDVALERSHSPAPTPRRTRATRSKAETASDVPVSCDSDGFESGPCYSRATRGRIASQLKVTDSDSDLTDVGKGTPSSSRTGSGRSSRVEQVSAVPPNGLSSVLEKTLIDQEESMDDSRLENTVVEKDAECTLIEENEEKEECETVTETKQKGVTTLDKSSAKVSSMNTHDESDSALENTPADERAVITEDHQEEPSAESIIEKVSEMEMIQETLQEPEQSAAVTTAPDSQITEDKDGGMEVAAADTDVVNSGKPDQEDGGVEMTEVSQTEASSVRAEAQQMVESVQESERQEEPVQATSSQQHQTTAERKSAFSLLDSSEDEDDEGDDFTDEIRMSSGDEEDPETREDSVQSRMTDNATSVDGLFMIDTRPGQEADEQYYHDGLREVRAAQEEGVEEEEDEEFVDEEGDSDDDAADVLFSSRNQQVKELSSRIDPGIRMKELGGLYISFDGSKSKPVFSSQPKTKEKKIQDEVMKKSVIGPDFEKKEAVPPYKESKHALKLKHRAERAKTTGDAWFNMKAPEITPELKGDLQLLRMRGSMDSKRFYKKNDRDGFPKYFQMGTVVDSPVDFYHSRVSKKDRKRTMVEELLADAEFRQKNKKKFQAIMAEKAAQAAGRRHKMKNKFHKK